MTALTPQPDAVKIVEVGPRDGLQNEQQLVDAAIKIQWIEQLANAGLRYIEAGSFVNPKWVPQMANSEAVFEGIQRQAETTYAALTPNLQGYQRALAAGANEVAVFAAASESFSQKNINCSIDESLARFAPVMAAAKRDGIAVRGYVSCVVACPYEGEIQPQQVATVAQQLLAMGCYEVSLGDTIGTGTPKKVEQLIDSLAADISLSQLAVHFHDTYGQALTNIYAALQKGIRVVDSSVAGLGGCPYAAGASGNVATEDVVYLLDGLGFKTGIDLDKLISAGQFISDHLGRSNGSKVALAMQNKSTAI